MAEISSELQVSSSDVVARESPMLGGSNRIHQLLVHKGGDVESVEPSCTVLAAVRRMRDRRVGSVLVVDGESLVGILTERDVLSRVIAACLDPVTTLVREVMTSHLVIIGPWVTVADALGVVTRHRCRHLPVVEHGRLCGLVSAGDLAAWLVREQQLAIDDLYGYIVR